MLPDPPLYSVREFFGALYIWVGIKGNIDWYWPEIKAGRLIGIRPMHLGLPLTNDCFLGEETQEQRRRYNYCFKWVGTQQSEKILRIMLNYPHAP